eukprot:TRINITY_DN2180_c0_g5_i1.p1 TRINITY_DN2180_c0_g5~~TRINITY_DN2180_c0_g5_i1.p1  ORF type:complete len:1240 (-),score=274.83 TRINITY_DN2180_c0_g5_i1:11-3730(-)
MKRGSKRKAASTRSSNQKTLDFFSKNLSDEEEEAIWRSIQDQALVHDITSENVAECYHLNVPPCTKQSHRKNCEANPRCYSKLGEKNEGIWNVDALKKSLGPDPRLKQKEPNTIVGLKNLGATCYMNSLLQCLFMNPPFRKGIFSWNSADSNESNASSEDVIMQLQMLFAKMQLGNKKYVSTKKLCQLLNLKTGIQQDIQEFNKLLLTFLEERFSSSKSLELKNLLADQFNGKQSYITKCSCGSVSKRYCTFNELELQIKDMSSLEDCLQDYIKEEELKDDNKYDCASCAKKQDATRHIALLQLPEVLNIQLMRFVYDMKTFTKRKLRTSISFPETLDVGPYLDDKKSQVYQLAAVLIHSGPSAYGGHYTAQIRDEKTGVWWRYDDDKVSEVPIDMDTFDTVSETKNDEKPNDVESETNGNGSSEENGKGKTKNKKEQNKKQKKEPAHPGARRFTSSNAYTLVYIKKGREIPNNIMPSENIQQAISEKNRKFTDKVATYERISTEAEKRRDDHLKQYENILSTIEPTNLNRYYWISTAFLSSWIKGEATTLDNTVLFCRHNKLDPEKITGMKVISETAWRFFVKRVKGGPPISNDDICYECVKAFMSTKLKRAKEESEKQHIIKLLANNSSDNGFYISKAWVSNWKKHYLAAPPAPPSASSPSSSSSSSSSQPAVSPPSSTNSNSTTSCTIIDSSPVKVAQSPPPSSKNIPTILSTDNITSDITCEHGNLAPMPSQKLLLISPQAWKRLKYLYENSKPWPSSTESCAICTSSGEAQNQEALKRKEEREKEKKTFAKLYKGFKSGKEKQFPLPKGNYGCILEEWLEEWCDYLEDHQIEAPPGPIPSSSLLCIHDSLKYDPLAPTVKKGYGSEVYLVDYEDYQKLCQIYGREGQEVSCHIGCDDTPIVVPEVCRECTQEREKKERIESLDYQYAKMDVELVISEEQKKKLPKGKRYTLRSQRAMTSAIRVNSTDSIHTVKLKIMEQMDLVPSRQKLMYNKEHLSNDDWTLAAYEIPPKSKLQVELKDWSDTAEHVERHQSEEGFKGTNLQNFSKPKPESTVKSWTCECGYDNSGVTICSLCGRHENGTMEIDNAAVDSLESAGVTTTTAPPASPITEKSAQSDVDVTYVKQPTVVITPIVVPKSPPPSPPLSRRSKPAATKAKATAKRARQSTTTSSSKRKAKTKAEENGSTAGRKRSKKSQEERDRDLAIRLCQGDEDEDDYSIYDCAASEDDDDDYCDK